MAPPPSTASCYARRVNAERSKHIDDLEDHEQLALGGLIRVLVRLDGSFSEEEEAQIEGVAAEIGSVEQLWHLVSRSAQELRTDDDIRAHVQKVVRPGARALIRDALESIARAGTIEPAEQALLDWLDEAWRA